MWKVKEFMRDRWITSILLVAFVAFWWMVHDYRPEPGPSDQTARATEEGYLMPREPYPVDNNEREELTRKLDSLFADPEVKALVREWEARGRPTGDPR